NKNSAALLIRENIHAMMSFINSIMAGYHPGGAYCKGFFCKIKRRAACAMAESHISNSIGQRPMKQ
ncbi:MAG: hypothetical protein LBT84_00315, partial [Spirochaetia bacterium]|nr:hypothetical protein [Spirochaetia bacterium]